MDQVIEIVGFGYSYFHLMISKALVITINSIKSHQNLGLFAFHTQRTSNILLAHLRHCIGHSNLPQYATGFQAHIQFFSQ
jgi:hypothetical protein